jgi:hypothetical protein
VQDDLQLLNIFSVLNAERCFVQCVDVFYCFNIYLFKNMLFVECTKD